MTEALRYARYHRDLSEGFAYGDKMLFDREGIVLQATQGGRTVYAEASPLPGHSKETIDDVLAILATPKLGDKKIPLPASLRWGLAGLAALAKEPAGFRRPLVSNALLSWHGVEATLSAYHRAKRAGFRSFKLKIQAARIEEQLRFLSEIAEEGIEAGVQARLDANASLRPAEASRLFAGLKLLPTHFVEYVEEPIVKSDWDHGVLAQSSVALAADESAGKADTWTAEHAPSIAIVKPMVRGSLEGPEGRRAIYTSTHEAEPGRRALIALLGAAGPREAMGLSTGYLFRENYLPDQAQWDRVPEISPEEKAWLDSLEWKDSPQ